MLDSYSKAFINYAFKQKLPSLEIGAAFGTVTIAALKKGAKIIANDLDIRHLEILSQNVPLSLNQNLCLLPGRFPYDLNLPSKSLASVFSSRVFHFLTPQEIADGLKQINRMLIPGGKLFVITETPYLKDYQKFIPVFECRKKEGKKWPGVIENVALYAPTRMDNIPSLLHFFDDVTLSETLSRFGFKIERASMFERPDYPPDLRLDGRESVGIIAVKV